MHSQLILLLSGILIPILINVFVGKGVEYDTNECIESLGKDIGEDEDDDENEGD